MPSGGETTVAAMEHGVVERALQRLERAASGRIEPAALEAALERAREGVEALAQTATELETGLPGKVEHAVREGVRAEALPVARQLAEVRGMMNGVVRRLERIEGDLLAERHARVDDLALLVDLITSGWRGVDARLERLERTIAASADAVVYSIDERRPSAGAGSGT
jgi:hypothetical protein